MIVLLIIALIASGTPQVLSHETARQALVASALAAPGLPTADTSYRSIGVPPDDDYYRAMTPPTASGANPPYPANHVLDADQQPVGTPPSNHDFESAGGEVGSAPTNADLEAVRQLVGTPVTNHDFETGTLTGWTTTGTVTLASDPTHGYYAELGTSDTVVSDAFTVDATTQAVLVNIGFLTSSGASGVAIYARSGTGYSTTTLLTSASCSACASWDEQHIDVSAYRGQSIKLDFRRTLGTVGIDAPREAVLFPDLTTSGAVSRITGAGGNDYARLGSSGTLITSPFTVASDAQYGSVSVQGATAGSDQFYIYILSGSGYATQTLVVGKSGIADSWTTYAFNLSAYRDTSIQLKVMRVGGAIGVDDLGIQTVAAPGWELEADAWVTADGASGQAVSTNGDLTSAAFTIPDDAQQLALRHRIDPTHPNGGTFYVELLRGTDFSTVTDLGVYIAPSTDWETLKLGVSLYAGETVKLRVRHWFGRYQIDDAGAMEQVLPGWTLTTHDPIDRGNDQHGSYVTPYNQPNGFMFLRSTPISTGIIDRPNRSDRRYYAISYEIGTTSNGQVTVYWVNSSGQQWTVLQDGASSPTGLRTRYFFLYDGLGTDGHFVVKLAGGRLYSIADNIARHHLNEPFSDSVGIGIDTTTGAFGYERQDAATEGNLPLTFTRYYAGHADRIGSLGARWSHTYDTRLVITDAGGCGGASDAGVVLGSGREIFFDWICALNDPPNRYEPTDARVHDTLVKNGDGTYTYTTTTNLAYLFSPTGRLESITDLNGNAISLAYDTNGQLTTVTDPDGRTLELTYTTAGQIETLTAPWTTAQDAVTTYAYDSNGDLVQATDPEGGIEAYTYTRHQLTKVERSKPGETTASVMTTLLANTIDDAGRVTEQTDAVSQTIQIDYDTPAKGATRVTDPKLHTATYYFDHFARTTDKVDPLGHVRSSTYDAAGNLQSVIDEAGEEWEFAYDANGNRTLEEDPLGNPVSYLYNPLNLPTEVTDARNFTTTYTYDSLGNLVEQEDPLGGITEYTYDSRGRVTSAENPLHQTETWAYNPNTGTLTTWTDRRGNDWTYEYDAAGRMTKETNPEGEATTYIYDFLGRLTQITDPRNYTYKFTYDFFGNLLVHESPLGPSDGRTFWYYNEPAYVTKKKDTRGHETLYGYDDLGNMTSITDPNGKVTTYTYDDANRLTSIARPEGGVSTYNYDEAGRVLTAEDGEGRVTTYGYDAAGRLTSKSQPGGIVWTYEYDANGNLTAEVDPELHRTEYDYDALNRLTTIRNFLNSTAIEVELVYDLAGRLTELIDARGKSWSYG